MQKHENYATGDFVSENQHDQTCNLGADIGYLAP